MSIDIDEVLYQHLQRNEKNVMWCTPQEISGGDIQLARELGRRMGRHLGESRGKRVVIGQRRRERRGGKMLVYYRIADISNVVIKSHYALQ